MILNTYSNIFTKLKNNIPELKYIALFDNQYANIEDEVPFSNPAVFIELAQFDFNTIGKNTQSASAQIVIHLCMSFLQNFSELIQSDFANEKLLFDILESIHSNRNYK